MNGELIFAVKDSHGAGMVTMFVGNQQSINVANVTAVGCQALFSQLSTNPGIEQESNAICFNVDAVSVATGLEGDHFHPGSLPGVSNEISSQFALDVDAADVKH